jgi:hypothetical protein
MNGHHQPQQQQQQHPQPQQQAPQQYHHQPAVPDSGFGGPSPGMSSAPNSAVIQQMSHLTLQPTPAPIPDLMSFD